MLSLSMPLLWMFALSRLILGSPLTPPTIVMDKATVTGVRDGLVDKFLGIPYALPP